MKRRTIEKPRVEGRKMKRRKRGSLRLWFSTVAHRAFRCCRLSRPFRSFRPFRSMDRSCLRDRSRHLSFVLLEVFPEHRSQLPGLQVVGVRVGPGSTGGENRLGHLGYTHRNIESEYGVAGELGTVELAGKGGAQHGPGK